MKLKNSKCDKTQIVRKLKNWNCDKTQKLKLWQTLNCDNLVNVAVIYFNAILARSMMLVCNEETSYTMISVDSKDRFWRECLSTLMLDARLSTGHQCCRTQLYKQADVAAYGLTSGPVVWGLLAGVTIPTKPWHLGHMASFVPPQGPTCWGRVRCLSHVCRLSHVFRLSHVHRFLHIHHLLRRHVCRSSPSGCWPSPPAWN